jgi:hypothetical protein
MKIPLFKKFLLMPRNLSWWVWLVTALCLTAGLIGYSSGFYAAVIISVIQTVIYDIKEKSVLTFPVQVRFAYTGLLILCQVPSLGWLYWVPTMGTFGLVLFGYCLMARILAGKPHGANEPGSDPTDVSDAAGGGQRPSWTAGSRLSWRRVRPRRPDRKPTNQSMNALSTKPVLEHAVSLLAGTAPRNLAKTRRLPISSFALCRRFVTFAFSANPSLRWMYQQPHQHVTCFPELVSASGERIFSAYWR